MRHLQVCCFVAGASFLRQKKLADMSLLSFIKIIVGCQVVMLTPGHPLRVSILEVANSLEAQINKSPLLAEYRNHPKLAKRHCFCITSSQPYLPSCQP